MAVFIVAEIGNMHNGSVALAKRIVKAAAACGVDAVKFQTHIFDAESLPDAPAPGYFKSESRQKYFERTAFSKTQWLRIKAFCEHECRVEFISSPFSEEAVDLLEGIKVRRYKIPSGEITNPSLLVKIAKTRKPVILSSGMSFWRELDSAVTALKENGCRDLTVLQCSTIYPCPPKKAGLNVLKELSKRYKIPFGLSDHTMGCAAAVVAVAWGATVVEKHFTLSRRMRGSDARHSLEPAEMKRFVGEIRDAEAALSHKISKDLMAKKLRPMKIIFEKSIVASCFIRKGERIAEDMIAFKKPGDGIRADDYRTVMGKRAVRDILKDTKITRTMIR